MKSDKGAITLYVTIACLFVLIIGIVGYISISNRQTAQIEQVNEIEKNYNDERTAEDIVSSYNGGDIIEINTEEEMLKIGSDEEVYINGKTYTLSEDKTYVLKDNWESNENFSTIEAKVEEAGGVIIKEYTVENKVITAADIVADTSYYGEYVNYEVPSSGDASVKWRIFYVSTASEESDNVGHIYLIADDYIDVSKKPNGGTASTTYLSSLPTSMTGAADMVDETKTDLRIQKWQSKYLAQTKTSTYDNAKEAAYMVNSANWSTYYSNNTYAEYAIGGPTLELFIASYNKTHTSKPLYCSSNSTGYYVSFTSGREDTSVSGLDTTELNNLYVIDANPETDSETRTR